MARPRSQGGTIRETSPGKFSVMVLGPDGKRRTVARSLNKADALARLRKEAVGVDEGTWREPTTAPRFGEYARKVIMARGKKASTQANAWSHLNNALAEFVNRPVDSITRTDLEDWWKRYAHQPVNRRNAYAVVAIVMARAVDDDLIAKAPGRPDDAPWKARAKPRPDWLKNDFERVLTFVDDPFVHVALVMLWASHARLGEVLGLDRRDYNVSTGRITINKQDRDETTKTGESRTFRLLKRGIDALDLFMAVHPGEPSSPLLLGSRGQARMPRQTLRRAWDKAVADAGLENFHLHDIRHASLTFLHTSGVPLRDIQVRSGHSDLAALQVYLGLDPNHDDEVAKMIDALS